MTTTTTVDNLTRQRADKAPEREPLVPADWRLHQTLQRGEMLEVSVRSALHMAPHCAYAGAPPRQVFETAGKLWILLEIPASRRNTEVIWDPGESELSIGVWSTRVERVRRGGGFLPRLLWYASFWLPQHDGARAEVRTTGARLVVSVPKNALEDGGHAKA